MPQKTNLNVYPYFDDFNPDNVYQKVLFKPGYPIQARELNVIQSMLQSQIEAFGQWAFQDGSPVIPGSINYNSRYFAVELKNSFNGIDIFSYIPNIIGKTIRGQLSGVRARILSAINSEVSIRGNVTLYVEYLDSDYATSEYISFSDGENILIEENVSIYLTVDPDSILNLQQNEPFASTIDSNCNSVGSSVAIDSGVYYIRGYFVKSSPQYIILDQYENNPSYRVGYSIIENIVTSEDDNSLNDNANGFLNYAAPGADRFSITLALIKVGLDEEIPENFVQILEIRDGIVRSITQDPRLNELGKELARRTYDESGDYYVKSPTITVAETLDDLLGNDGIYSGNQLTFNGNVPKEDIATYQISPLKAYVKGYEIETVSTTFLDFEKARTTKRLENQNIIYNTGSTLSLNRVFGSPKIGFSTVTVSLRDQRTPEISGTNTGKEIGLARVYDFALESGSYDSLLLDSNQWDISLYDIQTYSEITVNENITLSTPTYIKGKSSGATAYLKYDISNSGILTAYNSTGNFINGERLIFNDVEDENTRVSTSIKSYSVDDVKSLYSSIGVGNTFSADLIKTQKISFGVADISAVDLISGISTISTNTPIFSGVVKVGDLVSYTQPEKLYPTYSKVNSVTATTLSVVGVTTVNGVCDGSLPISSISVSDLKLLGNKSIISIDNTLYTKLPKDNVSSVDLTNSTLTIRKQFDLTITLNSTGNVISDVDEVFLPFDEENYVLISNDGITEKLTSDMFDVSVYNLSGGSTIKFNGLLTTSGSAKLIATLTKSNVKEKKKNKSIVKSIVVDKSRLVGSGIGETTLNNGLVYGNYPYGTRVEDDDICLLQSDVNSIYGIFEQNDSSNLNIDPTCPTITLSNISGPSGSTNDISLGETFVGQLTNAVAICVEKVNSNTIGFVYLNSNTFAIGESLLFESSLVDGIVNSITSKDKNITSNYIFDNGQRATIYDYSRIIRKNQYKEPIRKIKIYFNASEYSDSDTGDITTVNSYVDFEYNEITSTNGIRNSDIIDIRPKVSPYVVEENKKSPFEFDSRSFDSAYNNSSKYVLASDESISCSYSFYLPRMDKILLSKDGILQVKTGDPAEVPQPPLTGDDSIELATAFIPAYTFNVNSISIDKKEYKRYTMSDISKLENRIENLEYYTTLSLLEKETAQLNVLDDSGNPRFKSGFFVDNFTTTIYQQKETIIKNSIDIPNNVLRPSHYTTNCDLVIGESSLILNNNNSVDINYSNDFIGTNIKKSGNVITLDYVEVVENTQEFSTRVIDVTSYSSSENSGSIILSPSSDAWVSQTKVKVNNIELDEDLNENGVQLEISKDSEDLGFSPAVWQSVTCWKPQPKPGLNGRNAKGGPNRPKQKPDYAPTGRRLNTAILTNTTVSANDATSSNYNGISLGTSVVSTDVIPYMRARNIEFKAERMKPFTRLYAFFDNVDVNEYIIPKLIEIEMVKGTFEVGETLVGRVPQFNFSWIQNGIKKGNLLRDNLNSLGVSIDSISDIRTIGISTSTDPRNRNLSRRSLDLFNSNNFKPIVKFRVCAPNHKVGPYNSPEKTYNLNPYNRSEVVPSSYSANSSILNIDTYSLSYMGNTNFYGQIKIGMQLIGSSSGAVATVKDIRLISDENGSLIGSFRIPRDNKRKFTTGEKVFKITNSSTNSLVPGIVYTSAEEKFYAQGYLNKQEETILSITKPRIAPEIPNETPPSQPQTPTYNPPRSTPTSSTPKPIVIPTQLSPSVPPQPNIIDVNRGGPLYANAAQNRLIDAYEQLTGNTAKNINNLAKKLGVDIDPKPGGNLTKKDGNAILKALTNAGVNQVPGGSVYVPGPGSARSPAPPKPAPPKPAPPKPAPPKPKNTSSKPKNKKK